MSYLRSPLLAKSLPADGVAHDPHSLMIARTELVRAFNHVRGDPAGEVAVIQKDFIEGTMPHQDIVSYVRYCEYMIATASGEAAL